MTNQTKSNSPRDAKEGSFGDHLDALRSVIIRSLLVTVAFMLVAFCFKDHLFACVLAPHNSDFFLFKYILPTEPFNVPLINVGLTEQFMAHIKVSIYVGLILASPYILYLLFGFIAPALYENEHKYALRIVVSAYLMFIIGTALNYCLIFPLTVRFLGTYNVSGEVQNMLSLQSYIDTLIVMSLLMGVIFELPVVAWILGRMGLINGQIMRTYRKHAFVVILIVAAIITPTTDVFTLLIVSLPIWLLYEASIFIVKSDKNAAACESSSISE